jgi:nucleoside 2-deoxyribosyltransferase
MKCPRCGEYCVTGTLFAMLQHDRGWDEDDAAAISHALRRMQLSEKAPELTSDVLDRLKEDSALPRPAEQADNLILWLGDSLVFSGRFIETDWNSLASIIGAVDAAGAKFVVDALKDLTLIREERPEQPGRLTLTFKGWDEFERLKRGRSDSRRALMAMAFSNKSLQAFFKDHLKPAVRLTGYELFRLDERPRAGLIDNRLRVEIRESRFIVADLTDVNAGSYWEAGFAEGLGKPVIYLCHQAVFDEKGTHFDTNHSHTIKWCEDNAEAASKELKATIRATLPGEAIMRDEDAVDESAA